MKESMGKDQCQGMGRQNFLKAGSAIGVGVAALGTHGITSAQRKDSGEKIDLFCHILPPTP